MFHRRASSSNPIPIHAVAALLSGALLVAAAGCPACGSGGTGNCNGNNENCNEGNGNQNENSENRNTPIDSAFYSATFDNDAEGWTLVGGAFATATPAAYSSGALNISGTGQGLWYFSAPRASLGDWSRVYGGMLQFALSRDTRCTDTGSFDGIVVLGGAGWRIRWGSVSGSQFSDTQSFSIRLDESEAWFILQSAEAGSVNVGDRAPAGVLTAVLGNLSELKVFGQRGRCDGVSTLDDVEVRE